MRHRLAATAILAISFAVMLTGLSDEGLWLDEAYGHDMAFLPLSEMARITRDDAHPPLYYAVLSLIAPHFGPSEYGLRLPSAASALLALPFAYLIGRRIAGKRGALVAMAAMGSSPFLQYYAREVRMYAPLVTAACACTYAALRLVDRPRRARSVFAYAVTVTLLMYLHYFGPFIVAADAGALLFLAARRQVPRVTLISWALSVFLAGVAFVPWALGIAAKYSDYAVGTPSGTSLANILIDAATGFAIGFPPHQLERLAESPSLRWLFQVGSPAIMIGLALVGMWPRRTLGAGASGTIGATILGWSALFPLGAVALAFGERQEIAPRYLAVAVAPVAILAGMGALRLYERSRPFGAVVGAVSFALSTGAITTFHVDTRVWRDDFRSLTQYIAANAQPGQIVVANAGYIHRPLRYYLGDQWPIVPIVPRSPDIALQTEALARRTPFVWLAIFQEYYADPDASARRWLDTSAFPAAERRFRGDLRLIGYSTERPMHLSSR